MLTRVYNNTITIIKIIITYSVFTHTFFDYKRNERGERAIDWHRGSLTKIRLIWRRKSRKFLSCALNENLGKILIFCVISWSCQSSTGIANCVLAGQVISNILIFCWSNWSCSLYLTHCYQETTIFSFVNYLVTHYHGIWIVISVFSWKFYHFFHNIFLFFL